LCKGGNKVQLKEEESRKEAEKGKHKSTGEEKGVQLKGNLNFGGCPWTAPGRVVGTRVMGKKKKKKQEKPKE